MGIDVDGGEELIECAFHSNGLPYVRLCEHRDKSNPSGRTFLFTSAVGRSSLPNQFAAD